jgi:hypothetical protein
LDDQLLLHRGSPIRVACSGRHAVNTPTPAASYTWFRSFALIAASCSAA